MEFVITITPDPTLQWVAIGRIIFCPGVNDSEGLFYLTAISNTAALLDKLCFV